MIDTLGIKNYVNDNNDNLFFINKQTKIKIPYIFQKLYY